MDRPEAGTAPRLAPTCREAGLQQAPRACARHRRRPGQWTATGPRTAPGRTAAGPQGLAASGTTSPRIHPEWHAPGHGRHVGAHRVCTRSALRRTPRGHRLGSAYTHTVRSSVQAVPGKGTRRAHRDRYAGYEYPAFSRRDVLGRPSKGPHAEQDSQGTHPAGLPVLLGYAADDRGRALIHAGTILVVFLEHDGQERLAPAAEIAVTNTTVPTGAAGRKAAHTSLEQLVEDLRETFRKRSADQPAARNAVLNTELIDPVQLVGVEPDLDHMPVGLPVRIVNGGSRHRVRLLRRILRGFVAGDGNEAPIVAIIERIDDRVDVERIRRNAWRMDGDLHKKRIAQIVRRQQRIDT